jgi:rSAM-associated Gly-rich repeat protein
MSSSRRMVKTLAALLPLGALGVSVALAASSTARAADGGVAQLSVANRLAAIRGAVSEIAANQADAEPGDPNVQKAQWLNFGIPGWRNGGWNNWRNGGWGNGPWGNGWGNGGWHNWHNGWRNW